MASAKFAEPAGRVHGCGGAGGKAIAVKRCVSYAPAYTACIACIASASPGLTKSNTNMHGSSTLHPHASVSMILAM